MDTTPVKDPEVRDAKDITAEYEATLHAAAQQHTPFDDETNRKLAELEKQTDAAMDNPDAKPGSLKNASFKFDPKDPRFQRMLRKYLKEQRRNAPKHENYHKCHKFCPLFKKCECFKKSIEDQKACFEKAAEKARKIEGFMNNSELGKIRIIAKMIQDDYNAEHTDK